MKTTKTIKPFVATVSTALLLGSASLAMAAENPFAAQSLTAGYQLAAADKSAEAKCGEAKCGADAKKKVVEEGKCGEAKCGADTQKKVVEEGKCGEAKCGADTQKKVEG